MYALLIVIALIVGGSLYPWHFAAAHANPWIVLMRSWPSEWHFFTMYDASANIVVYLPLGALAFVAAAKRRQSAAAIAAAILTGLLLSLGMELLQVYVPGRTSSLFDLGCNVTGALLGALAAWRFGNLGSRFGQKAVPPVLLLGCWACYHLYPFVPMILFARMRYELMLWLHPESVSLVEIWRYAAEWVAVGVAVQRLFGRVRLPWLSIALAFHFAVRPFVAARPLVLEELLGLMLALLLWKTLSGPMLSSPWLLISAVLSRACFPSPSSAIPVNFFRVPFQVLLASTREVAIQFLSRTTFDYAAILWLWRNQGISWGTAGAILTSALAVLAVMQRYLHLSGDGLSMTDPALALLLTLVFRSGSAAPSYPTACSDSPVPASAAEIP